MMMARRRIPMPPQPAQLSMKQVRAAIPRLERRAKELSSLDMDALTDDNFGIILGDLVRRIDDTLISVYGADTIDYRRYEIRHLDDTSVRFGQRRLPIAVRKSGILSAIARAVSKLLSAIIVLKERVEEAGETAGPRSMRAYSGLDPHPEITRAASKLYRDGMGLEGIFSKHREHPHRSGRSKSWLKVKNPAAPGVLRFERDGR